MIFGFLSRIADIPLREQGVVSSTITKKRLCQTVRWLRHLTYHQMKRDQYGRLLWHHPFRVMKVLQSVPGINEKVLHAALLHDLPEVFDDISLVVLDQLGYSYQTIEIVDQVVFWNDRPERGGEYLEWIRWLVNSGDDDAQLVKLAALLDNLKDPKFLEKTSLGQMENYHQAVEMLKKSLPDDIFQQGS